MSEIESSMDLPAVSELKLLLERYFVGPVDDDVAVRLHSEMEQVLSNRARHMGEVSAFHPDNARGNGSAWREEFALGHRTPSTADLALFHAAMRKGYPKPKPYCPAVLVGTWGERDGNASTWDFVEDGRFTATHAAFKTMTNWCVWRFGQEGSLIGAQVRVREAHLPWRLLRIVALDEQTVELREAAHEGPRTIKLQRRG